MSAPPTAPPPSPTPTVIIPAYNAARTIAGAVASALSQCPRVIVVDDGSSDDTATISRDGGAQVIHQPNAGPATARNTALSSLCLGASISGDGRRERSSAPFTLFLDADDELLPGAVPAITDAFARNPTASAVIGAHIATPFEGASTTRTPDPHWLRAGTLPAPELALGPYHVFCTSGLTLSPAAAFTLRFDPALHFAEDRDLVYRAAKLAPIAVIDRPLITKHTGRGVTDDPRRVQRWLHDQLALAIKHCPPSSRPDPAFDPLRDCTEWVVKHALRTGARHAQPIDPHTWRRIRAVFSERAWPLGTSIWRAYLKARLAAAFTPPPPASPPA